MKELAADGTPIRHETTIHATPAEVWAALTDPARMPSWMADPSMGLQVETDWTVGGPIRIRGRLHGEFTNTGTVLAFTPPRALRYTHLSSASRLPGTAADHAVIDVELSPRDDATHVVVTITDSPTEAIRLHLDFYWGVALAQLRRYLATGSRNEATCTAGPIERSP